MSGRKGLPPVALPGGPAFPAAAPGRQDMVMAFAVFLGRETSKDADLAPPSGLDWRGLILRFVGSDEFLTRVLPQLLEVAQPGSNAGPSPEHLPALAAWMARVVVGPGLPTEADLAAAPSWQAMLAAWLGGKGMIGLLCPTPGTSEREVAAAWALDEVAKRV